MKKKTRVAIIKKTKTKNNRMKTTKNEVAKKKKKEKHAMEFTFGAQVGVEALSSDLHMARAREIPY
jgi:hypothetical protein